MLALYYLATKHSRCPETTYTRVGRQLKRTWWGSRGAGGQLRQHSAWFEVAGRDDFWGKGQWSQNLRFKSNFSLLGELEGGWSFQTKKTQIRMQSKAWLEDLEMRKGWYYVIWEWQGCVWMVSYWGGIFIVVGNKNGGIYKMEHYLSNKTPPSSRKDPVQRVTQ